MNDTDTIIDGLARALMDTTGHLRTHCRCVGSSLCVACEIARGSNDVLERHRAWRAEAAELLEVLSHEARCAAAVTERRDECDPCAAIHQLAGDAHQQALAWSEVRRG